MTKTPILLLQFGMLPSDSNTLFLGNDVFMADNLSTDYDGDYQSTLRRMPAKLEIFSVLFCASGSIVFMVDGEEYSVTENQCIMLQPGVIVEKVDFSTDTRFVAMSFSFEKNSLLPGSGASLRMMEKIFSYHHPIVVEFCEKEMAAILALYSASRELWGYLPENLLPDAVQGLIDELVCVTLNRIPQHNTISRRGTRGNVILVKFINLLNKNATRERSVSWYAGELYISPKHFSRLIKRTSGKNPEEWIKSRVILEAKTLLLNSDIPIGQVAEMLNFANASFFSKYFKAATGFSPGEIRKKKSIL